MIFDSTDTYISTDELSMAVDAAVKLERPLLVKGEPGTGKTLLAHAIAEGLGMELISWHVKSTSKAQDGLYVYDTVQRLNDSRFGDGDVSDIGKYIKLGPLGQAFSYKEQCILLLDEIDKADMEFPNDLLHELDRMSFHVNETDEEITAQERPVIIITSNYEKELPDAFLRRCVFHFITFPDAAQMETIVRVHHPNVENALLQQVLAKFYWIRQQPEIRKHPSTSELVDWIAALQRSGITDEALIEKLPFLGVLLKREQDIEVITEGPKRRSPWRSYLIASRPSSARSRW